MSDAPPPPPPPPGEEGSGFPPPPGSAPPPPPVPPPGVAPPPAPGPPPAAPPPGGPGGPGGGQWGSPPPSAPPPGGFTPPPPSAPPPGGFAPPPPGGFTPPPPGGFAPPPPGGFTPATVYTGAPLQSGNNGIATAAMVLGILILCFGCLTGIPALACGIIGLKKANELGGTGKGQAIAGIVLGALSIVGVIVYFLLIVASGTSTNGY